MNANRRVLTLHHAFTLIGLGDLSASAPEGVGAAPPLSTTLPPLNVPGPSGSSVSSHHVEPETIRARRSVMLPPIVQPGTHLEPRCVV